MLDGEAVILDARGRSSFAELQADLDRHGSERAVLYAFDLLFMDGEALWKRPLEQRRLALGTSPGALGDPAQRGPWRPWRGPLPHRLRARARGHRVEALDRAYRSGRSRDWLKTKCVQTDSFVIIGYQPGSGAVRTPLANIKIATFDGTRLRYAGAVGTGFSETVAALLRERLDRIVVPRCILPRLRSTGAVWVDPTLHARVAYRGVTTAGELRHARFKGLEE